MTNHRVQKKQGFTLVELLVVNATAVVLLATTLPAVQQSRESARALQCRNHLKQIGLALHNYHDVHSAFAPGWTAHHPLPGPQPRHGWQVAVLPYLYEAPLYEQLDHTNHTPPSDGTLQKLIPVLRCPSDSTPATNPLRGDFGTSNYSGNFGSVAVPRWLPGADQWWPGHVPTVDPGSATAQRNPVAQPANGIFRLNRCTKVRDIIDGMSNTFMVGERSFTSGAGIWRGVRGNEHENDQVTDCSVGHEINAGYASFSSRHPGGAHFLMSDGAVRFIKEDIQSSTGENVTDLGIYQLLSHAHDRQRIPNF